MIEHDATRSRYRSSGFPIPLDPLQREAAHTVPGSSVIIGGPGSGKTHTLIGKVLTLLSSGVEPSRISLIIHDTGAARKIRDFISALEPNPDPWREVSIGTFSEHANLLLRAGGAGAIGIATNYPIWDHSHAFERIQDLVEREVSGLPKNRGEIYDICQWRSRNCARLSQAAIPAKDPRWHHLMESYQRNKKAAIALDQADLIDLATLALRNDQDFRGALGNTHANHTLVDDCQDITPQEYWLLQLMTESSASATIAIDPNQQINKWRGTDVGSFDRFLEDNPEKLGIVLPVNHRATGSIHALGTALITSGGRYGMDDNHLQPIRIAGVIPESLQVTGTRHDLYCKVLEIAHELCTNERFKWYDIVFLFRRQQTRDQFARFMSDNNIAFVTLGSHAACYGKQFEQIRRPGTEHYPIPCPGRLLYISTIHEAKCGQWKAVFLMDANDDVMPGPLPENSPDWLEEEYRVFYVGATRSSDRIYFGSYTKTDAGTVTRPSRFLDGILSAVLHHQP